MILYSSEYTEELFSSIKNAKKSVCISSAFVKLNASKKIESLIKNKKIVVSIIARWQKRDLLAGASDLDLYPWCKKNGWKFGIDTNLHGKLFFVDEEEIYLGSANLTSKGLGLIENSNTEFGVKIEAENADVDKINRYIQESVTWLDDDLYLKMVVETEEAKGDEQTIAETSWSQEIKDQLNKPIDYLWVQELPFSTPSDLLHLNLNNENSAHDFDLMAIDIDRLDTDHLKRCFAQTKIYGWLYSLINREESINFGGITAALHNALLDDPLPYRSNIKEFVAVIFEWLAFMDDTFELTKHNVTTSVKLKE